DDEDCSPVPHRARIAERLYVPRQMTTQGTPPPGWYPNPEGQGRRYWDGSQWTSHFASVPSTPSAERYDRPPELWAAVAATVVMIIGAVGPWATVFGINISGTGSSRDGSLVIILAVISIAMLIVFATTGMRWPLIVTLVLAILSVIICIV